MIKVLFVSDIHLLPKTPAHRDENYLFKTLTILDNLIQVVKENNINCIVYTGDIFDRGFPSVKLVYLNLIIEKFLTLYNLTKGNCYTVLGNHEQTYTEANPFYMIADTTQSPITQSLLNNKATPTQVTTCMKVVDKIEIANCHIHLFHYDKLNKNYKTILDTNVCNIGVYHDDLISFSSEKELYHHSKGQGINVHNTDIFDNISLAVLGHIHKPFPTFICNKTLVMTPGCIIPRTASETHTIVNLPMIEILEDNINTTEIPFDISTIAKAIDVDSIKKSQNTYQTRKLFKMTKASVKRQCFDEMLQSLPTNIVNIINKASSPLVISDLLKGE